MMGKNQKKMTSRSRVTILMVVSLISLALFITYTDNIKSSDILPKLPARVKMTLCYVWTATCRNVNRNQSQGDLVQDDSNAPTLKLNVFIPKDAEPSVENNPKLMPANYINNNEVNNNNNNSIIDNNADADKNLNKNQNDNDGNNVDEGMRYRYQSDHMPKYEYIYSRDGADEKIQMETRNPRVNEAFRSRNVKLTNESVAENSIISNSVDIPNSNQRNAPYSGAKRRKIGSSLKSRAWHGESNGTKQSPINLVSPFLSSENKTPSTIHIFVEGGARSKFQEKLVPLRSKSSLTPVQKDKAASTGAFQQSALKPRDSLHYKKLKKTVDSRFSPQAPKFTFPQTLDFTPTIEKEATVLRYHLLEDEWKGRKLSPNFAGLQSSTLETDYHRLQQYLNTGGLNMTRLSMKPWPRGQVLPWEVELLKTPPLMDLRDDSSYRKSKVTHLDPKETYAVGDRLRFRIDIYDGRGKKRNKGGDEVRLWITENAKVAGVAGEVVDLNNGSYLGEVVLRWPGAMKVKTELTFSRAALRLHHYFRHVVKCTRYVTAGYVKNYASESTLCSPFPFIPGYKTICDYSDVKYGTGWYCGKPRNTNLTCKDWTSVRDMDFGRPFPFTDTEAQLSLSLRQPPHLRLIPNNITIYVDRNNSPKPRPRCSSHNFSETWDISKSRGYFIARRWVRTDCKAPKISMAKLLRCLMNTTLVFTGDSNLLILFNLLRQTTSCTLMEAPSTHWHRPRSCTRSDIRFHMAWALHGLPAHALSDHWAIRGDFQSITTTLDNIPPHGRFIIVIHLFIHMSMHHQSVFFNRISAIRQATETLLARNPNVTVVIRGPHTSYTGWPPVLGGDMMGILFRQMTVRAFEGLHERVLFLDFWDMTIAAENPEFHPPSYINRAILGVLFGHVCSPN